MRAASHQKEGKANPDIALEHRKDGKILVLTCRKVLSQNFSQRLNQHQLCQIAIAIDPL